MRFKITVEITDAVLGRFNYTFEYSFDANSNVFGRVIEFRNHIHKTFPGCEYTLISAKQLA